jgi:uroporphyrinogen-III decarboxylase
MTSRDRVVSAFRHEEPDKVPRWCGASAEFWDKAKRTLNLDDEALRIRFGDDFRRVSAPYVAPDEQPGSVPYRTPFGIERQGLGYGQPTSHPLAAASMKDLHAYPWPDACHVDVSKLRSEAETWHGQYAVLGGDWSPFWHDAIDLLGMETLYFKMFDEPVFVDALLDHIVSYYEASSRRIFEKAADLIDIFFIGNDFGSQTGPLMGVELFRRFMLPHLKRLITLGHDCNLWVQLHCCGGFEPLLPDMIEAGLDAVHAIQPCCHGMDLRSLKAHYGHKIVFNGGIDSHHVLIQGDSPDFVRKRTLEVLSIMAPGGGYVAGASHDSILEETPVENVLAMFDAVDEFEAARSRRRAAAVDDQSR